VSAAPVPAPSGDIPPQNLDGEASVLGCMLLAKGAIGAVAEVLDATDFYLDSNARIYRAILDLDIAGGPVDAVTVVAELDRRGQLEQVGGRTRVFTLARLVPPVSNARHYAELVREAATRRGLIQAGGEIAQLGWEGEGEIAELLDGAEQRVFEIGQRRDSRETPLVGDRLDETWQRLQALSAHGGGMSGVPSGFRDLDRLTSGFQPENLIILAGRPSMGKTSCCLTVAAHVALRQQRPVALFSLEMSHSEIQARLWSMEAMVDGLKFRSGALTVEDWGRLNNVSQSLRDAPILVEDAAAQTMLEIRAKARRVAAKHPDLALVIVDYIQLIASHGRQENRNLEVAAYSRALKVLARELGVPVLALSQLSRDVEKRHDKRPMLSDLRDSGSLEQDADLVMFLYRDEYYNAEDAMIDGTAGVCEVNLAKQRNGPTGTIKLHFEERYARFGDMTYQ